VPVWVALPVAPDWRWLLDREDSPWYPTMRLFRQAAWGDWEGVFHRLAAALTEQVATAGRTPAITVEISPGELIEKITLREVQGRRLVDAAQLRAVAAELAALRAAHDRALRPSEEVQALAAELMAVQERLWEAEEAIRACEREGDFGERFIELARSVSRDQDRRAALRRQIDERLGSRPIDERSSPADS
jgi:hypothetical protein